MSERLPGRRTIKSLTDLSDDELGMILDKMRGSGSALSAPKKAVAGGSKFVPVIVAKTEAASPIGGAEIMHLASSEQVFTLEKLQAHIEWTSEQTANYLSKRFKRTGFRTLLFEQANRLTIQMLNIAAHRDLKKQHGKDVKISRKMTAAYIPELKRRLDING